MQQAHVILIEGIDSEEVINALKDWAYSYRKSWNVNLLFKLYETGIKQFVLICPFLKNDLFFFLVNFLKYPGNIVYEAEVLVVGYTHGDAYYPFNGRMISVYPPDQNRTGARLHVVTQDHVHYDISLAGKVRKRKGNRTYQEPTVKLQGKGRRIILETSRPREATVVSKKTTWKVRIRFRIILGCILLIWLLVSLFRYLNFGGSITNSLTELLYIGTIVWIYLDYVMLRSNRLYVTMLVITLLEFLYHGILTKWSKFFTTDLLYSFPFLFLIFQRPVRLLFLRITGEEPEINYLNPFNTGIYSSLILLFPVLIIWLIEEIWG